MDCQALGVSADARNAAGGAGGELPAALDVQSRVVGYEFPSRPPKPRSNSTATTRDQFWDA